MSKASQRERYEGCAHRFACDRMARLANLLIWYSSEIPANESTAEAYECGTCKEWKREKTV